MRLTWALIEYLNQNMSIPPSVHVIRESKFDELWKSKAEGECLGPMKPLILRAIHQPRLSDVGIDELLKSDEEGLRTSPSDEEL
jgi:hypothetical protein